jgi:hypothetical protein
VTLWRLDSRLAKFATSLEFGFVAWAKPPFREPRNSTSCRPHGTRHREFGRRLPPAHNRIDELSGEITTLAKQDAGCERLVSVPGIGPMISSAMMAAINTSDTFSKGRDFAAWLGVVSKQVSTGDRTILGKISKRGNRYLRVLFVQAAWVVLISHRAGSGKGLSPGSRLPASGCTAMFSLSRWPRNWPASRGALVAERSRPGQPLRRPLRVGRNKRQRSRSRHQFVAAHFTHQDDRSGGVVLDLLP